VSEQRVPRDVARHVAKHLIGTFDVLTEKNQELVVEATREVLEPVWPEETPPITTHTLYVGEEFLLRSQDPDGDFVEVPWRARIIPRVGDYLALSDGTDNQRNIEVTSVVLHADGRVDVLVEGFGWNPGSVKQIFERLRKLDLTSMSRELWSPGLDFSP